MRRLLIIAMLLLWPVTLHGQQPPWLKITQVRVGFPSSAHQVDPSISHFKAGAWAPVFVDITAGRDGWKSEALLQLVVETPDNSNDNTRFAVPVPLPVLAPNQSVTVHAFTKPASTYCPFTVSLRSSDDSVKSEMRSQFAGLDMSQGLYLLLGADLADLGKALRTSQLQEQGKDDEDNQFSNDQSAEFIAVADRLAALPDQWFGYEAVDLIVLTTGQREFLNQLAADARRRQALAQWVVRGGHLIVSAGKNQAAVAGLGEIEALLPVRLTGVTQPAALNLTALAPQAGQLKGPVEVARLEPKPGRSHHVVIGPTAGDAAQPLLVVQGVAGLGRVTVVGFDMDENPFKSWAGRGEFLAALIDQASARQVILAVQRPGDDQLSKLFNHLERFDEVPVISFGWVALFIFLYILIVGPLDYWVLKHVVKRLELTWITFPTVVILISVIAYFTAYQMKGRELRLHKLDLVDIDLGGQQAYGRTWLTVFSPRIDHYTVGLEPAAGGQQAAGNSSVVLSWLGRPVTNQYAGMRNQSLFQRSYDFAPNAIGLDRVPIQVWATKSFTAAWSQSLTADPLVTADLRQRGNKLSGSITWRPEATDVGLSLNEASLIYRGNVHPITLPAGKATPVELEVGVGGRAAVDWLAVDWQPERHDTQVFMRSALFFSEARGGDRVNNHGLRNLDQSWRLAHVKDEAILVARLPSQQGPAEEINQGASTPSRLWLGALPAKNTPPPPLVGVLRQETYMRVFIPVRQE